MKILNAQQIKAADAFTIKNEPIKSIDLMERASHKFVEAIEKDLHSAQSIAVFCGTGNNGGDGLAVSRILNALGYQVQVYIVQPKEGGSDDFQTNLSRLDSNQIQFIKTEKDIKLFKEVDIIIDALFGSGLSRKIDGLYANIIRAINHSSAPVYSIDMPSGLYMDAHTPRGAVIEATKTITFQLPKLSFLFPENQNYVGEWEVVDIGLDQKFITDQASNSGTFDEAELSGILPKREKFSHKGNFGHGQIIAGSYGKMGATILASRAFLRSGAGLLSVTIPQSGIAIMQTSLPEAMVTIQEGDKFITEFKTSEKAQAIGIGPGLGMHAETAKAYKNFLGKNSRSLVIDADGINLISAHRELLQLLPKDTIITPHIKEFDRLVGDSKNNWERLSKAQELASKHNLIIVLKGAHTAVINSSGEVSFNNSGNPGMATAGSGDVLLGIISSLRTQGLSAFDAARAGVFIHGRAGDFASQISGQASLLASDIVDNIAAVIKTSSRKPFVA